VRAGILTVSTSRVAHPEEDHSGPALTEFARGLGAEIAVTDLVPDDRELIESTLRRLCDTERCDLVLTTGGTGFAPTDVTPEATRAVIDRDAPGIAEAMRLASQAHTRNWMLSRAVAGLRGRALIVNFPGSPDSIRQAGDAIAAALPHAVALASGERSSHDH
jgi:molybdenum cofactor synthesis domain-containing protein